MRFNPALDAECIQPGERVHIPSSDELLRGMKKKLPRAPLPLQSEFDEQGDLLEDAGDWPPAGSKVHRAIMERHTGDKPPAIAVVAGTIAVAVAVRALHLFFWMKELTVLSSAACVLLCSQSSDAVMMY